MTAVLDQVKNAAYASVGVNLLVTDAIVGRELPAPEFVEEHASIARKQATEALTDFRARTEPRAIEFEGRFPEQVADVMASNRVKAWDFIGINAPKKAKKAKKATKAETTES
ncbi:MAG: hypothetical protein AAF548_07430 [Actinomycetota bacterium]